MGIRDLILLLGLLALWTPAAPTANAAIFVTDSPLDGGDAVPGDGACASILAGNPCTLRAAVQEANALPGRDVIELPTLLYSLNIPGSDDAAVLGDLDVTDDLEVRAVGFPTIEVTHGQSAFELRAGVLELRGLALDGGGVETLAGTRSELFEVEIFDAARTPVVNRGTMTVYRSEIRNNTAGIGSGGIDNSGTLLLSHSRVNSNSTTAFSGVDTAAAILNRADGRLSVSNVEIFGNSVTGSMGTSTPCASSIANSGFAEMSFVSIGPTAPCDFFSLGVLSDLYNDGTLHLFATRLSLLGTNSICAAPVAGGTPPTSLGYNTTFDPTGSCLFTSVGDDETGTLVAGVPRSLCALTDIDGDSRTAQIDCVRGADGAFGGACANGADDDGDGFVDLQDPGCADPDDPSEAHVRPGDALVTNFDTRGLSLFDPESTRLSPITRAEGALGPWDVTVDAGGQVLLTDGPLESLTALDLESGALTLVSAADQLAFPTGLAQSPAGDVFVADNTNDVIVEIDLLDGVQSLVGSDPSVTDVDDLLFDPSDGSLLIGDPTNGIFRMSDPLGSPSFSPLSTTLAVQPRQLAFDGLGDFVFADDGVNSPLRYDVSAGDDLAMLPTAPFADLQGAAVESGGLGLFADITSGLLSRVSESGQTATTLNVDQAAPGLRHLALVPSPATVSVALSDALVVDGGVAGQVDAGDTLELTAVVTNDGAGVADLLSLQSGLGPNLTLVAGSLAPTQGTIVEGSLATDPRLEVDLGSLAAAATATVTWEVVVSDPTPDRTVSANAWVRREKLILAESDDPTTAIVGDRNVIGVGDFGVAVQAVQKISDTRGKLSGAGNPGSVLSDTGLFGGSLEPLGDIDGDGVDDLAVGAYENDDEAGVGFGAFYILLMNADGSVKQRFQWNALSPDLAAALATAGLSLADDQFGSGIAYLGDLDAAGPSDFALAVSAWYDDGLGGTDRGAVYILFMDQSPLQVLSVSMIGDGVGGFPSGQLSDFDYFGNDVEAAGDIDGDGVVDLAVGAHLDDTIGGNSGGVWILFLNPNGTVKASPPVQILVSPSTSGDFVGLGIASLGLFDGDGVPDLAVSATRRDVGGADRGAVWILTLNANGTVKTQTEISPGVGGLPSDLLEDDDRFGRDLETLPDLDGDGVVELLVGANRDDDAGDRAGAVYALFLTPSGTTDRVVQLAPQPGLLFEELGDNDRFGLGIAPIGDLDGDGGLELAVSAALDDDGAGNAGAVYVLSTIALPEPSGVLGLGAGVTLLVGLARADRRVKRRRQQ